MKSIRITVSIFGSAIMFLSTTLGSPTLAFATSGPKMDQANVAAGQAGSLNAVIQASCKSPEKACMNGRFGDETIQPLTLDGLFEQNFCDKPAETICAQSATTMKGREQALERFQAWAINSALKDVAVKLGRDPHNFSMGDLKALPPAQFNVVRPYFSDRVMTYINGEITKSDLDSVWRNIGKIKGYLYQAIDQNYPLGRFGDLTTNLELKKTIQSIQVMSREDILLMQASDPRNPDLATLQASYADPHACGELGLSDNAFALPVLPSGKRYVIVCPGMVMGALKGGMDPVANFRNVLQGVAHEMGHHIDSLRYPGLYSKFSQCLATSHADGLVIGPKSSLGLKMGIYKDQRIVNSHKAEEHLFESAADYWATEAIVQYLNNEAPNLTMRDRLNVLREAYGALCGTGDEGVHPDGKFRLEVLLRSSATMNIVMGCKGFPNGKPACSLAGATTSGDILIRPVLLPLPSGK